MQKFSRLITVAGLTALIGAVQPVWAESAPVFDVDNYDQGAEQSQDLPMPPPPGEEAGARATTHQVAPTAQTDQQAGTFVPVDANGNPQPANQQAQAQAPTTDQTQNPTQPTVTQSAAAPRSVPSAAQQDHGAEQQVASDQTAKSAGMSVSTENLTPEQRMRRLEQQLSNMQNNNGNPAQVEALQAEVQSLRGQVEQLNHQLEKVQAADKAPAAKTAKPATEVASAAGADVDPEVSPDDQPVPAKKKSSKAKASADSTTQTTAGAADVTKGQPDVAEEQKAYQAAYDLIKAKKYPEAVSTLQGMLKKYPSGQFASNAHYWLGELYGLMGKHDEALNEFSTVIEKFPGSPRVSDAQLKVGLILAAQSKWADAKKAFNRIINTYPGTASSRLASEQLKQIKLAGH